MLGSPEHEDIDVPTFRASTLHPQTPNTEPIPPAALSVKLCPTNMQPQPYTLQRVNLNATTWRCMGSYKWGYKSLNMSYK